MGDVKHPVPVLVTRSGRVRPRSSVPTPRWCWSAASWTWGLTWTSWGSSPSTDSSPSPTNRWAEQHVDSEWTPRRRHTRFMKDYHVCKCKCKKKKKGFGVQRFLFSPQLDSFLEKFNSMITDKWYRSITWFPCENEFRSWHLIKFKTNKETQGEYKGVVAEQRRRSRSRRRRRDVRLFRVIQNSEQWRVWLSVAYFHSPHCCYYYSQVKGSRLRPPDGSGTRMAPRRRQHFLLHPQTPLLQISQRPSDRRWWRQPDHDRRVVDVRRRLVCYAHTRTCFSHSTNWWGPRRERHPPWTAAGVTSIKNKRERKKTLDAQRFH